MLKKSRKLKHISIGIFACTVLSLASVGFSTWIISLGEGNNSLNLAVNIDVSYDFSKVIDYTPSGSDLTLNVEEKSSLTLGGSSDIVISDDVYNSVIGSGLNSLTLESSIFIGNENEEPNEENNVNKVTTSTSEAESLIGRENSTELEYFSINTPEIKLDINDFKELGNSFYQIDSFDMSQFGIVPGSFFKNKDPKNFYEEQVEIYKQKYIEARDANSNIDSALNDYLSVLELYGNDIDTMHKKLNGKVITITITLMS